MSDLNTIKELSHLIRRYILTSTTEAGSGHPTSSLSATDLMAVLYFKYLRYDLENPQRSDNDRIIFSKGHAAPLFFALYTAAGATTPEELHTLRKLGSPLQGHPTPAYPHAEAATGSLGQGLSIGVGMALNAKLDGQSYKTYVLMGDGEMAEGSVWEAIAAAEHYQLNNLVGIIDVNRLGQSQETMFGHDVEAYARRVQAFGWHVEVIDGHDLEAIDQAYQSVLQIKDRPCMIVAKTLKGAGVKFLADQDNWHGKPVPADRLAEALNDIPEVDENLRGTIQKPETNGKVPGKTQFKDVQLPQYKLGEKLATRKAYGLALAALATSTDDLVVLDGDTKNSTFAEDFAKGCPKRYFEMFIAEQNMMGVAVGFARRGKIPFASTFAAFLSRAYDQVRMGVVSQANLKVAGSHVGVSIGEDGPSQMGLEDIAMFRALNGSTVLYPGDPVSATQLTQTALRTHGLMYLRLSRPAVPALYSNDEDFPIGGSKTLRSSDNDQVTLVAAGITLHEALAAAETLANDGINARVIDCYSVKPIDADTLQKAAQETQALFVIEDHWPEGGIGDAVLSALATQPGAPVYKVTPTELPGSGAPEELIEQAGLSAAKIVERVKAAV